MRREDSSQASLERASPVTRPGSVLGGPATANSGSPLPHAARLVRRILTLEGPLIQLWAWPGSGANGILGCLCDRLAELGQPLSELRLHDGSGVESALAEGRARGCRWFVSLDLPDGALDRVASRLAPGERFVFSGWRRRHDLGPEVERTPPTEAFLREVEALRLWEDLSGHPLDERAAAAVRAIHVATGGWYRPLVEVFLEVEGSGLDRASAVDLIEIEGVRSFLRHEVVALWTPSETERWSEEARRQNPQPEGEASSSLHDPRREGGDEPRLPLLLATYLRREAPMPPGTVAVAVNASYTVSLFGTPAIYRKEGTDDRAIECRLRRSLQAFAYLASSSDLRATRDELIGAIWPNEGERTIDRNFHPTLSHLRRALEGEASPLEEGSAVPPILFRGGVYQLNPVLRWQIDTREFQTLAESGRRKLLAADLTGAAEDWREAWRLYRGPFMQGFFDLWIAERRELLQQQYLELLRDLGDVWIRLDRAEEAMDAYRSVLAEDPLQERVHVAVLRLYAAQGRRDLVKRQYERLCSLLLEELGVAPLAQTTEDYHLLME